MNGTNGRRVGGRSEVDGTHPLTPREAEVLFWVCQGKTNKEIGAILGLSARTVQTHLERVFRKLNVGNRAHAAATALLARLIPMRDESPVGAYPLLESRAS